MDAPSIDSTSAAVEADAKVGFGKGQKEEEEEKKTLKIWVLRCIRTGRVLYLEAYKDFVDILLGFLALRTGAVIKLTHEISPMARQVKSDPDTGILSVYESLQRLDDSLLFVDKEILLDPVQRLRVSEELRALESHDFECCNADCSKYMATSRQVCSNCTISTHFSCITCGGYFRENAHTSLCYTPWRPWGNHVSAAPILTRYTVIQSCSPSYLATKKPTKKDVESGGYVKTNIPFIITNELHITPLSTSQISQLLKKFGIGSCEDLECNELSIGTSEVIVMLGAAMTSTTPLTDVFGGMCNKHTKVFSSASFSQMPHNEKVPVSDQEDDSLLRRHGPSSVSQQFISDQNQSPEQLLRQSSLQMQANSAEPPGPQLPSEQSSFHNLPMSNVPPMPQQQAVLTEPLARFPSGFLTQRRSEQLSSQQSDNQHSSDHTQKHNIPPMNQTPYDGQGQQSLLTRSPSSWLTYIRQSTHQVSSDVPPILPVASSSMSIVNPLFQQTSGIAPHLSSSNLPQPLPVDNSFPQPGMVDLPSQSYVQENLPAMVNMPFPPSPLVSQQGFREGSQGTGNL